MVSEAKKKNKKKKNNWRVVSEACDNSEWHDSAYVNCVGH
jgi:hypothetical protein